MLHTKTKQLKYATCIPPLSLSAAMRTVVFRRNNIGIRTAKGKYIFLINNDTYIESDNIACLIERLESRPEIGGVSPKIRFAFPPQHIQFAGFTPLSRITLRNNILGFDCPDDGTFDTPHSTPYLHGAAMMLKREVIEKAGMMPEIFFSTMKN